VRTTVVNVKDCPEGWQNDQRYVYVGRSLSRGGYGNRHRIGPCYVCGVDHDRWQAVKLHAEETRSRFAADPGFRKVLGDLRGKYLVCHCKRTDGVAVPCHADVYVELLESA
jgi:hypothetical protein